MPQSNGERPTLDFVNDPKPESGSFGGGISGDFFGGLFAGMEGAAKAMDTPESSKASEQSSGVTEASPGVIESLTNESDSAVTGSENDIDNAKNAVESEATFDQDQRLQLLEDQVRGVHEQLAERQQVLESLQAKLDQMQDTVRAMETTLQEMQTTLDVQNETLNQVPEPMEIEATLDNTSQVDWSQPVSALATILVEKVGAGIDRYQEMSKGKKIAAALGAVGVVAAGTVGAAWLFGVFDGGSIGKPRGAGQGAMGLLPVEKQPTPLGGPVEIFSDAARTVHHGEGWYETFNDLGIPQDQWSDRLNSVGPELAKEGWAYWDEPAGEWRISRPGQLPDSVLQFIKNA